MKKINFNRHWDFTLSSTSTWRGIPGEDAGWRAVDLPHDWSITLPRSAENPCEATGGFFTNGQAWYRKTFSAPQEWGGKTLFVEFEGVYMNAEVLVNGNFITRHPYGYTSFIVDITPYVRLGEENSLAVLVDNGMQRNSRWYSGAGIYRPVWLYLAEPIRITHWGTGITTPEVTAEMAKVDITTTLENTTGRTAPVLLRAYITAPDGSRLPVKAAPVTLAAGEEQTVAQNIAIEKPALWNPDHPSLYALTSQVIVDGQVVDSLDTTFGIRSIEFSAEKGFLLNGLPTLLKGGCVHHDNGILGAASFPESEARKVALMKASGFNAIRCAHNPPAPSFLDACDRMGMLVIDEAFDCWRNGKLAYDYHIVFDDWWQRDLESMVYRDRNHPSIIMWSIGNEVIERNGSSNGVGVAHMLADHVRSIDSTRPITSAINGGNGAWEWSLTDDVFAELDVCGYNYEQKEYAPDHERKPQRIMYGSESMALDAYAHWQDVKRSPWVIGDFVWTSLDYLGEAGIGREYYDDEEFTFLGSYPWNQANCGDIDLIGTRRPQSRYREVLWGNGRDLYIMVHDPIPEGKTAVLTRWGWHSIDANWTWPGHEDEIFKVDIYSNGDEVELFLNGRSLGRKVMAEADHYIASYEVPYAAGALKAVAYRNGTVVAEKLLNTVGEAKRVVLRPECSKLKAGKRTLSFIRVHIVDSAGHRQPNAAVDISFTVKGAGKLLAVGSGNPATGESYMGNQRRTYRGRALIVIEAGDEPGECIVCAQAKGLESAEVHLNIV